MLRFFFRRGSALLLLAVCLTTLACQPANKPQETASLATEPGSSSRATLRKDGEVTFEARANHANLAKITVQVADNEEARNTGLMYRTAIPDSAGMLFILEELKPQSFWMKNTAISLDIIFADDTQAIVKIHSYTLPYAIDSYPSEKSARYAVEVNGGFCEKHGIKEGDFIRLHLPKK